MKRIPLLIALACLVSCLSPLKFSICADGSACPAKFACNAQTLICEPVDAGVADSGPAQGPPDAGLDAGPDGGPDAGLLVPLPRYGMTVVRGQDLYGTVYAIGGIDASGQLSTRVDQFLTHNGGGRVLKWDPLLPPALAFPVAFASAAPYHNVTLQDGELLIAGIDDGGTTLLNTEDGDLGQYVLPWGAGPTLLQPTAYAGAAANPQDPGPLTWLVGGFDSSGRPSPLVQGLDLQSLPFIDGGWGSEPPLSHARGGLGVSSGPLSAAYAVGGWESDAGSLLVPSGAVEVFYADGGAWSDLAPLPLARGGLAVASDENFQVFAIGGSTGVFGSPIPTAQIDVFNTDAGTWTTLDAGLPTARWALGAAFTSDAGIVIFGGQLPDGGVSGETDILNTATLQMVVLTGG